jgi:hypothetical protein
MVAQVGHDTILMQLKSGYVTLSMVDQTDNFLVPRALFKAAMVNKKIML